VGNYQNSSGPFRTLIEHWNGKSWGVVASPNVGTSDNYLNAVATISISDVWVVGDYQNNTGLFQTLIEHWNGESWNVVPSPNVGTSDYQYAITATSARDVWVVGDYQNDNGLFQTLIEHWNGTTWSIITSPNPSSSSVNRLISVTAITVNDVWTVGDSFPFSSIGTKTLIEHWNGTTWSIVPNKSPGTFSAGLSGVAAVSASDVWAVGNYQNSSGPFRTLIEHWNGESWGVVASLNMGTNDNYLNAVAAVSASGIQAVGNYQNSSGSVQPLIEHCC